MPGDPTVNLPRDISRIRQDVVTVVTLPNELTSPNRKAAAACLFRSCPTTDHRRRVRRSTEKRERWQRVASRRMANVMSRRRPSEADQHPRPAAQTGQRVPVIGQLSVVAQRDRKRMVRLIDDVTKTSTARALVLNPSDGHTGTDIANYSGSAARRCPVPRQRHRSLMAIAHGSSNRA